MPGLLTQTGNRTARPAKRTPGLLRALVLVLLTASLCFSSACLFDGGGGSPSIPDKNTLRLVDAGPATLDPALSQDITSHTYVIQVFSGLVALDDAMNVVGDIAETWETSNDGRTFIFHLRNDARFHDGTKITAVDFKYSWERACNPDTGSATAPVYLKDIVGAAEVLAGAKDSIEGVTVMDEHTLRVVIDAPKAYFLAKLTYPVAFVVDRDNVESSRDWWREPNGSGPFKIKHWETDELLLLQRNDLYYGNLAKLDYVAFLLWGGASMQMYERDEIDVTYVSLYDLERVLDPSNPLHEQLQISPELSLTYVGFNCTAPPFDDSRVRQAFAHAVDRNRIVSQLLRDAVEPTKSILPPGMPGYTGQIAGLAYDLDKAKELLAAAGYPGGAGLPPLVFACPGQGGEVPAWIIWILWDWEQELNVNIEINQIESDAYFYNLEEQRGDFFYYGWVADYPDPEDFLDILFRSGSPDNEGGYSNAGVDALLEQAAVEQDMAVRFQLYREAEQIIVSDAACVPLWTGINYLLVKPYVEGFSLNALGLPSLAQVSIVE